MGDNKNANSINVFIGLDIYPDVKSIFKANIKCIDDVITDCMFVLDTNSLLMPYKIQKASLEQIRETYTKLVQAKRLLIPGQVMREFANNRPGEIVKLYQQLLDKKSKLVNIKDGNYPLFENLEAYHGMCRLEEEIDKLLVQYKKNINYLIKTIKGWYWNDPISQMYSEVFDDECFIDLDLTEDQKCEIVKELENRYKHNIPPGYKDSSKPDKGIGDFLIWKTILDIGRQKNKDVVFVSSDLKPDWWHSSAKQNIYPRYELLYEFMKHTDGRTFNIIQLSTLLNLFNVSRNVVEEIENQESIESIILSRNKKAQNALSLYEALQNAKEREVTFERINNAIYELESNGKVKFTHLDVARQLTGEECSYNDFICQCVDAILNEVGRSVGLVPSGSTFVLDEKGQSILVTVWNRY